MRVAAIGYDQNLLKCLESGQFSIHYFDTMSALQSTEQYDAFFVNGKSLLSPSNLAQGKLIFINSVLDTLDGISDDDYYYRVNHWPGFVENEQWEIVGKASPALDAFFTAMDKNYLLVNDNVGFITARILAMIINEAHYAMEDKISSPSEIDVAMKLGTGYPYGPMEWGEKIGLNKIYDLLNKLSQTNERYLPSKLLTQLSMK